MNKSLESILTRLISIVAKFILVTFLTKVLTLLEYGTYQLITYFVMISIYIYGVEYYMFGNREVAKGKNNIEKINTHINFFFTLLPFTFIIQLVGLFLLVPSEILTPLHVFFILFINFCEYFNQEIYRYLIMVHKVTKANILLVAKSSILLVLVGIYYLINKTLTIDTTLLFMFVSYGILLMVTAIFFYYYILDKKAIKIKFLSVAEVKKIFRFLLPFIGLMVCTKGLEFFDKFAIEHYLGTKEVGIYSFLFSIASLVNVFIVSGFYIVYLPKLIKLYEEKNVELKKLMYNFSVLTIVFSLILSLGEILFIDILLNIIGKESLSDSINILYLLLGAFFFLNLSLIPRIILYIANKDKTLMLITTMIFGVNIILNFVLLRYMKLQGAALALLITYLLCFLITSYKGNAEWKKIKLRFS